MNAPVRTVPPKGLAYAPHGYSGLTPKEATVMAEWDRGGQSIRDIARKLGYPRDQVNRIVTYYDGVAEYPKFCRATTAASDALAAAIGRAFPERASA